MPCGNLRFLVVEDHEFRRRKQIQLLRSLGARAVYGAEDSRRTEMKIKSSFVAEAHSSESARAGLAVGLDLAHQLKLKTVADGIQSKEKWKQLREWGCEGQGPFIPGPLQAEAVTPWIGSTIH